MMIPAEESSASCLLLRAGQVTFTNEPREVEHVASGMGTVEDEREATLVRSLWAIRSAALDTTAPDGEELAADEEGATRSGRRGGNVCTDTDAYILSEFVYDAAEGGVAATADAKVSFYYACTVITLCANSAHGVGLAPPTIFRI